MILLLLLLLLLLPPSPSLWTLQAVDQTLLAAPLVPPQLTAKDFYMTGEVGGDSAGGGADGLAPPRTHTALGSVMMSHVIIRHHAWYHLVFLKGFLKGTICIRVEFEMCPKEMFLTHKHDAYCTS